MKGAYKKVILMSILTLCLLIPLIYSPRIEAIDDGIGDMITDYFTVIDDEGNTEIIYLNELQGEQEIEKEVRALEEATVTDSEPETTEENTVMMVSNEQNRGLTSYSLASSAHIQAEPVTTRAVTMGIAYITTSRSYIEYKEVETGNKGYTAGSYGVDAAYLGSYNGKARIKISGVVADVDPDDVTVVSYASDMDVSYYIVSDGYLLHRYYYGSTHALGSTRVGFASDVPYLSAETKYYSYDGHYFYTNYETMLNDYRNDTYSHAVNASSPHYNYYQYLSHRSKTQLTGSDLNQIVSNQLGSGYSSSKLYNLGDVFISSQNQFGVNALLAFGVAVNESNWGRSAIAQNKNNLFGHGAVDEDPYAQAGVYSSPEDSVKSHAYSFVSKGYLDSATDGRYRGGHLGDKQGGMNVKYASDPYWGEKAAARIYYLSSEPLAEHRAMTIGILGGSHQNVKYYASASYSASYVTVVRQAAVEDLPVIILDTVQDSSGNTWYKVQSDVPIINGAADCYAEYDYDRDVAYIPASLVTTVINGTGNSTTPSDPTQSYTKGDVNGDGRITPADYVKVKNYIMETSTLTGEALEAADMNGDGQVTAADYVRIKNIIMS